MTKVHWIAIAVVAIILLVIFGHNPIEAYRKRALLRANQNLVTRIMKHNDPDYGKKPKHPVQRQDGVEEGVDTSADKEDMEIQNDYQSNRYRGPRRTIGGSANPSYNAVAPSDNGAYNSSSQYYNRQPTTIQPRTAVPAGGDNYYPPVQVDPMSRPQPYMQAPANSGSQAAPGGDNYYPPTQ